MLESKLFLFCVIVLMIRPNSGQVQEKYVGQLECTVVASKAGCDEGVQCVATCDGSCAAVGYSPKIWGTRIYTWDTPICRAAAHDYRMTAWGGQVNVTFQRTFTDTQKYLDSIQQYIGSRWYGKLSYASNGHYVFTSPYVNEAIVDAATINSNFLSDPDNGIDFVQKCAIDGTSADITFSYYTPTSAKLIGTQSSAGNSALVQQETWTDPNVQPGGYICNLRNNVYSNVMSINMRSNAYFAPEKLTITANVGDNVVLKFIRQHDFDPNDGVEWLKNEESFNMFSNMNTNQMGNEYTLTINNVDVGDGAVYSFQLKDSKLRRGVVRLIVRRCPAGKYGTKCDQTCPACANGGICHDVMGTCVCAPGFNGDRCQNACPGGSFGEQCTKGCSGSCKGVLVCLPDPYGCSCAPGYSGFACDVGEDITEPGSTSQTIVTTNQPIVTTNQPIVTTNQPIVTTNQPIVTTNQPIVTTNRPFVSTNQPIWTTNQPIRTTQRGGFIIDDDHFYIYHGSLVYVCPKKLFYRIRRFSCKRFSGKSRRAERNNRKCQEYLQKNCKLFNSS